MGAVKVLPNISKETSGSALGQRVSMLTQISCHLSKFLAATLPGYLQPGPGMAFPQARPLQTGQALQ